MSTKNPAYPDTRYADSLIGPDTVTTLPEATIALLKTTERWPGPSTSISRRPRTRCEDSERSAWTWRRRPRLKQTGMASPPKSFREVLAALDAKSRQPTPTLNRMTWIRLRAHGATVRFDDAFTSELAMTILDTSTGTTARRADPWRATILDSIGDTR